MHVTIYVRGRAARVRLDATGAIHFREVRDGYLESGSQSMRCALKSRGLPTSGGVVEMAERLAGWRLGQPVREPSLRGRVEEILDEMDDEQLSRVLRELEAA